MAANLTTDAHAGDLAFARAVAARLQEAGFQAYFAGGCVRDRLMNQTPRDYDVATDATPPEVMKLFPRHSAVGAQFGVVLAHDRETGAEAANLTDAAPAQPPAARDVAVATFRTESSYRDGRHPEGVRYARRPEEDVARRDFTVNGLLYDPIADQLLDFVGGREDLTRRVIRAIGDPVERFAEDRLRLLRAIRFAARLEFAIEPATWRALQAAAPAILGISPERIRDEILRMLTEGRARRAFELLADSGLLEILLPEVARMRGVEQPPQFHPEGDVWTHTLMMLEGLPAGASATLALGVLLHDVGKPPTFRRAPDRIRFDRHAEAGAALAREIARRLVLSGADSERLVALVAGHMRFMDAPRMRPATLKRFLRQPGFDDHLELHRLDCRMSHGGLETYEFVRAARARIPAEELHPPRLLTGRDLIALGYAPGPRFKEILRAVEEAQLEGTLTAPAEAQAWVRQHWPE